MLPRAPTNRWVQLDMDCDFVYGCIALWFDFYDTKDITKHITRANKVIVSNRKRRMMVEVSIFVCAKTSRETAERGYTWISSEESEWE